jgi:hypothetical protein
MHHIVEYVIISLRNVDRGTVRRRDLEVILGIALCEFELFLPSRRIAGNDKQVFVYHNGGYAYGNVSDVSAESLDMLALVYLLLVGDDPNHLFVLWFDGCLGVEPRSGLALAEGLCEIWGITLAEGLHEPVLVGCAPFHLYPDICLTTEEKHGKPQSE